MEYKFSNTRQRRKQLLTVAGEEVDKDTNFAICDRLK